MTTYALILDNEIQSVGGLPNAARRLDTGQWLMPHAGQWTDAQAAACGYLPVVETERPPDTETTTSDSSIELIDGVPTQVWTVRDWTQEELDQQALTQAQQELAYAVQVNSAPEQLAAVNAAALTVEGITEGDPWRQPTGAQDAYPIDWVVSHNGKQWASTVGANVWEPGVSGWRETGTEWPDWVQPTGSHDAYPKDAQVTHVDAHWVSLVDANTWEPGVYGWTQEGPA